MKKKIVIFGAGNISFRHCQALINKKLIIKIFICDIDFKKYINFKKKFNDQQKKKIFFFKKISSIKKINFFLCIVCTTSKNREKLLKKIFKNLKIRFVICEKIVETNINSLEKLYKSNQFFYINIPMRLMKPFRKIKSLIKKENVLQINKHGNNWNLLSNSLHYINYFSYALKTKVKSIKIKNLSKKYFLKRTGYIDFFGKIVVEYSMGAKLNLVSNKKIKNQKIEILTKTKKIVYNFKTEDLKYNQTKIKMPRELISKLTSIIFDNLIKRKKINLPTFKEHFLENYLFLDALNKKLEYSDIKKIT